MRSSRLATALVSTSVLFGVVACVRPSSMPSVGPGGPVTPSSRPSTRYVEGKPSAPPESSASESVAAEKEGDGRTVLPEDWPPETRSLEVRALAHVLERPADRAPYIGKITRGTRVAWVRVVAPDPVSDEEAGRRKKRKPCPAWVEIEPQGYLCKDLLNPSVEGPHGVRQPVVKQGQLTPDVYFKVNEDETKVYKTADDVREDLVEKEVSTKVMVVGLGVVDVDGWAFQKTDHGLIDATALSQFWPSPYEGRDLRAAGAQALPFAWIYFERWSGKPRIYRDADTKSERVRRAERREIVSMLEERGEFVRIGDGEWIERKHLRIARAAEPPAGVGERDQWVDVDLDEQVLVAYEGKTPVFATLVSTGRVRHDTPAAIYRVRAKAATTPMAGDPRVPNRYEVSGVPWAVRFAKGFYVHGAYWHDGFGSRRSHGCVNLSPKDAAFFYEWVGPAVPDGWSEIEVPMGQGVVVRIRDREHPDPPVHDYSDEES